LHNPKTNATAVRTAIHIEPRRVTGQNLAHVKRTATERALLAADIADGSVVVAKLTLWQAIALTGASPTYAAAAVKLDAGERRAVRDGWRPADSANCSTCIASAGSDVRRLVGSCDSRGA
jgi:hypothetical protein